MLCESEKIDELAIVINPDHIILTHAEKAQLFDDFDLDETDDDDNGLITIHYQHFRPKQPIAFVAEQQAAGVQAAAAADIEESESTETETMVDIDQNAEKSENVVNGWSDDEQVKAEVEVVASPDKPVKEKNTATITPCGWTLNSDTEQQQHEEGKRKVKIKVSL